MMKTSNSYDSREAWLRAAANELRPHFEKGGYPLPANIRFAIAFPSTGRKGKRIGECWHASTSADDHFEIFIRADQSEPVEVLGILVHELVHATLPIAAGHGKLFKAAALKLGLEGLMRHAMPGSLLRTRLTDLAATLGPLPHARLAIERGLDNRGPADRPKKQGTRMRKAECAVDDCPYTLRIAASQVRTIGPPHCPLHGPMTVDLPAAAENFREAV
jgi:hypothetical protein